MEFGRWFSSFSFGDGDVVWTGLPDTGQLCKVEPRLEERQTRLVWTANRRQAVYKTYHYNRLARECLRCWDHAIRGSEIDDTPNRLVSRPF